MPDARSGWRMIRSAGQHAKLHIAVEAPDQPGLFRSLGMEKAICGITIVDAYVEYGDHNLATCGNCRRMADTATGAP